MGRRCTTAGNRANLLALRVFSALDEPHQVGAWSILAEDLQKLYEFLEVRLFAATALVHAADVEVRVPLAARATFHERHLTFNPPGARCEPIPCLRSSYR
jgi:hypothetical protein